MCSVICEVCVNMCNLLVYCDCQICVELINWLEILVQFVVFQ